MANLRNVNEEVKETFNKVLNETSIPEWVNFEILANDKQKEVYVIKKSNDLIEHLTDGINFVVILNEEIFDQLPDHQQEMLLKECLAGVTVDFDKDTVALEKPNFTTYGSILRSYGHEDVIALKESVKSLYDAKKQQEEEEKAARKGKRGRKKNFE